MTSRSSARPSSPGTGYLDTTFDSERLTIKESSKPRKLIVCIDGTSNQYSEKNTNVIELYSHIVKSDTQLTYYNSGIGTYAKPSWRSLSYLKQVVSNGIDLAIAWNLEKVIIGAYRWLSDNYKPGDQIFLFGFSRGAYQVRAIAGMIASVGLIFPGNQEQIPFAFELYADYIGDTGDPEASNSVWLTPAQEAIRQSKQKVDTFRKTFSRPSVDIHFLGVWDTVSSIGIRRGKLLPLTDTCEHVKHFRHALALDERRVKFLPEHVQYPRDGQVDPNHIKEVWFAGTHSDIGGGNTRNIELNRSTEPLVWMMNEAEEAGLAVDSKNLGDGVKRAQVIPSLTGVWWALEVMPLARLAYGSDGKRVISQLELSRPHLGRGRKISENHKLHYSVLANYLQVENQKRYKPYAKYKVPGTNGRNMQWEAMFHEAESQKHSGSSQMRWEGDRRIIEVLRIIREVDAKLAASGGPDQRSSIGWLNTVARLVDDDECAKMFWEYGSLRFLLKTANFEDEVMIREIVRGIVGIPNGLHLEDHPDTRLRIVQDVIPRLPDLLTCYKRSQRRITIDPGLTSLPNGSAFTRSIHALKAGKRELWSRIRKVSVSSNQIPKVVVTPRAPARSSFFQFDLSWISVLITALGGTKDSTRTMGGLNSLASFKLVQIALEIISELAENGFAHDVAAADVVHHLIPLLTLKPPSPDADEQFRRLTLHTLNAITKLALGDELAGSKFYPRNTTSKVISLMKDDKKIIKAALRTLAALAADPRNLRYFLQDRFVDALNQSLRDPDASLVSQAIETIAAVAEDGKLVIELRWTETIDAYLVQKEIIPQILPVLSSSSQQAGQKSAIQALRRLCNNDTARSQLYEHNAIAILHPFMKTDPNAIFIIESLALHDEARRQMIENDTLASIIALMESPSRSTLQRAIHSYLTSRDVVSAFCSQADGRREVIKKGLIQRLIPMLRGDLLLCDVLEVVSRLALYGKCSAYMQANATANNLALLTISDETRKELMKYRLVEELLETLKRQKVDVENRISDGLFIYPVMGDTRFPQTGGFDDESTVVFTKTLDTIAKVAQLDDIRDRMLELQLIEVLLEQGLGTPRMLGKAPSSPVVPEDIDRSQEVIKCLGYLAAHENTRLELAKSAGALHLFGWFIDPQFRCPQLACSAMSTIRAMSRYDDTLAKLIANKNIGEGVIRAIDSPVAQFAQEAKFICGRLINDVETRGKMKQYLKKLNRSFVQSRDFLPPPVASPLNSTHSFVLVTSENLSMDSLDFATPASTFEGE
ncbi:hypothetical protein FRC09_011604 [Ceratobasidium sp. 395]|nr:hypothetical protein FRC09_011604 [Ceratobasidium sp. 395]